MARDHKFFNFRFHATHDFDNLIITRFDLNIFIIAIVYDRTTNETHNAYHKVIATPGKICIFLFRPASFISVFLLPIELSTSQIIFLSLMYSNASGFFIDKFYEGVCWLSRSCSSSSFTLEIPSCIIVPTETNKIACSQLNNQHKLQPLSIADPRVNWHY